MNYLATLLAIPSVERDKVVIQEEATFLACPLGHQALETSAPPVKSFKAVIPVIFVVPPIFSI